MNQDYYNAVTKMEQAGVDPEYIVGWEGGYVLNPPREEPVNQADIERCYR